MTERIVAMVMDGLNLDKVPTDEGVDMEISDVEELFFTKEIRDGKDEVEASRPHQ